MMARTGTVRDLTLWLALFATSLRAFIPVGFMPATGSATLVLCTASGPRTVLVADTHLAGAANAGTPHCPFGFAIGMAATVSAPVLPELAPARAFPVMARLRAGMRARPRLGYSSRAPPRVS